MTTCSISPLRQRMIEDMSARKLSTGTQKGHLRAPRHEIAGGFQVYGDLTGAAMMAALAAAPESYRGAI